MPKANIIQKSLICLVDKLGFFVGRGSRDRTHGTRFWRPLLYLLSYTPVSSVLRRIPNRVIL